MSVFEEWPHRWFGTFREQGDAYALCPSVLEFVDPDWNEGFRGSVLPYLESAYCLAATSRFSFPCVFEGSECLEDAGEDPDFCVLTDGVWTWNTNLPHYVRYHNVRIPEAMIRHMEGTAFVPPTVIEPADEDWEAYTGSLPHAPFLSGRDTTAYILKPRPPRPDVTAVREAAAAAFRDGDFPRVAALYTQIEGELSLSERRKMQYAKERSEP